MAAPFLDLYEPLDIIGNGSFGVIRKVRRKSDGLIFARKELNFERMSERDRKQIVAEVNILKDLHHDHIVRYHDRHVDRDAGILYILMEYCGGGDLSTVIKQATKHNRPIPEDTIWNYFLQILLALQHCHHPPGHGRSSSGTISGAGLGMILQDIGDGKDKRAQILHRDLKPDNVFLDEANTVKLGDFGLSKALAQASFANTYVGTPYYMSPELMQEKAYDSKSDIWSLGCLIYELCALKPPFHEAKTHAELSILIRNGRVPPLPRGYSQSLSGVIKAMLNLNPAMRPSAAQLLQHERLELVFKVAETEKMLTTVKAHKASVIAKEQEVLARESELLAKEQHITSLISHKDNEIIALQQALAQQQQRVPSISQNEVDVAIKHAIARREEELRILVMKREEEVAVAIGKREEEIMEAVRQREAEVCGAWVAREAEIRTEMEQQVKELNQRAEWISQREEELRAEEERLATAEMEIEEKMKKWDEATAKGKREHTPLEEVKNLLAPLAKIVHETPSQRRNNLQPTPKPAMKTALFPSLETPISRPTEKYFPSAMKGVVLTNTGEALATPRQAELSNLFDKSPKVGLNFAKIFDFDAAENESDQEHVDYKSDHENHSPPPSPTSRKERERKDSSEKDDCSTSERGQTSCSSSSSCSTGVAPTSLVASAPAPPTRLRRPSIRSSAPTRPALQKAVSVPNVSEALQQQQPKPLPHPHLHANSTARTLTHPIFVPTSRPSPEYDFADEENLPSPFLKRIDRTVGVKTSAATTGGSSTHSGGNGKTVTKKRPSNGNMLRAVAAANNVGRRTHSNSLSDGAAVLSSPSDLPSEMVSPGGVVKGGSARPSVASARKASEEARKVLLRP